MMTAELPIPAISNVILKRNTSMTIYYLYVKTHLITGLKYLGQTKRKDPYKYLGSGTRWIKHLNAHGKLIKTEILKECQSKEELKEWGLHYSKLWNIVKSKEWANLIDEMGLGGSLSGELNGMFGRDHTTETKIFLSKLCKERFIGKSYIEIYGEEKAAELKRIRSSKAQLKDNSFKKNPRYDPAEYCFFNILTGEMIFCTRWVFLKQYKINRGVSDMINRCITYNNWCIVYN